MERTGLRLLRRLDWEAMENLVEWNSILAYQIPISSRKISGLPLPSALSAWFLHIKRPAPCTWVKPVAGRKFSLVCVLPSLVGGGCERYHCASQQQHESSTYVPPAQRKSVSWLLAGCRYLAQHVVQTDALTGQRFVNCMQLSKQGDVPFPELPVGERDGFRRVPDGGA